MSETSKQALNPCKDLWGCFNTRWCSTEPPRIVYASRIPPRRPRTLRTWLGSARNFGNTRFGRFAIFDFLTPKKKIEKNNFRKKKHFRKKIRFRIGFSLFSVDFGGARLVLTSKSDSWRFFASDGRVLRPVRGLEAMIDDESSMIDDFWLKTNDEWLKTDD